MSGLEDTLLKLNAKLEEASEAFFMNSRQKSLMEIEKEIKHAMGFEQTFELMRLLQQAGQWQRFIKAANEKRKAKEKLKKCLEKVEKMKNLTNNFKPENFSLNPGFSSNFSSNDILNYAKVISGDLYHRIGVKTDDNSRFPALARRPDEVESKSSFYYYSNGNPKGKVLPKPVLMTDAEIKFENPGNETQYYFTWNGTEPTKHNCQNIPGFYKATNPIIQRGQGSLLKVRFEQMGLGPSMVTSAEIPENEGTTDMMIRANIDEVIDTWILTDMGNDAPSVQFE